MVREGSPQYKDAFGAMPSSTVEDRPESVMNFMMFLRGRERIFAQCAAKDVAERSLGETAQQVAASLADVGARVRRSILAELLYRGLLLAKVGNKEGRVALARTLDSLEKEAADTILDV